MFSRRTRRPCGDACMKRNCEPLRRTPPLLLARAVGATIAQTFHARCWASAFADVGLTGVMASVSARTRRHLELAGEPGATAELPTFQMLSCIFPGRSVLPIDEMFDIFRRRATPQAHASSGLASVQPLAAKRASPCRNPAIRRRPPPWRRSPARWARLLRPQAMAVARRPLVLQQQSESLEMALARTGPPRRPSMLLNCSSQRSRN